MKACKALFNIEDLLKVLGLRDASGISVCRADISPEGQTVTLYLTGQHPDITE